MPSFSVVPFPVALALVGFCLATNAFAQTTTGLTAPAPELGPAKRIQTDWRPPPAQIQQQTQNFRFVRAQQSFERVREILMREALSNQVNEAVLFEAATQGMLRALNQGSHQWNELLSPQEVTRLKKNLNGEFTGIGIEIDFIRGNGTALIKRVLPDSPAEAGGLLPGDQILTVNGQKFKDKSMSDMVGQIRGPIGEKVTIKLLRNIEILDREITRAEINMSPVKATIDRPQIGYLKVKYFNQETPKLIKKQLAEFNKKNIKGLVLDLRKNFGGVLGGAVATADVFLPKGQVIAQINGRNNLKMVMRSKNDPTVNVPIVVLINKQTSSGAELLASSLKENLKIKLVGENSFGKWNAQSIRHLPNNFAIKYTVYEFRNPNNKSYHNVGLTPDVVIANPKVIMGKDAVSPVADDKQLETAYHLINSMI